MSAKRGVGNSSNGSKKKRPKQKESDFEDEISEEESDDQQQSSSQQSATSGAGSRMIPDTSTEKLPADLLASLDKTPGHLLIAGCVTWDMTGKRDRKNIIKARPNLYNFHRFTDQKVSFFDHYRTFAINWIIIK